MIRELKFSMTTSEAVLRPLMAASPLGWRTSTVMPSFRASVSANSPVHSGPRAAPGGVGEPPHLVRKCREGGGRVIESQGLDAAQRLGMEVPEAWAYRQLGIPEPSRDDDHKATEPLLPKMAGTPGPPVIAQPPISFGGDR